jgi:ferritin-like metal-binding protein YciE
MLKRGFMGQMLNLRHLLQHEVEDLNSAEDQIIEALPQMIEMSTSPELKKALNEHLKVTREQKKRLEKVQQALTRGANQENGTGKSFFERIFGGGTKCKGMEGLIKEGQKMMSEDMDPQVRDAAIIASCQKIEHYEISGYGTARAYANQLNLVEVERLLQTTLNEEYKADDLLTVLALQKVNADAGADNKSKKKSSTTKKETAKKPAAKKKAAKKAAPKKTKSRS